MAKSKTIRALEGQSLLDIALQASGDLAGVATLAEANDMPISGELETGAELRHGEVIAPMRAQYYEQRRIQPATGTLAEVEDAGGIFGEEFERSFE